MSTPDKSFIAVDPESGATYRFNETDWQEKKDRLLERYPKAEIMEYDSYNPEDVQENDSIFVTVDDGAYSFTPSEWLEKQEKLMARYPKAQVNRVRGVNYWEEKAVAQEEAIKAKRAEMQSIPQDATELWGNNPYYLRNLNELEELEKAYKANPYAQMKEEQEKSSLRRLKETTEKDYADFMKEYEDVVYGGGGAPMSTLVGSSEDAMMEGFARSVGSAVRGEDLGRQEEFNVQKPLFDAALRNIQAAEDILAKPNQESSGKIISYGHGSEEEMAGALGKSVSALVKGKDIGENVNEILPSKDIDVESNAIANVFKGLGAVYGSPEFWSRGMNKLVTLNNGGNAAIEKINRKLQEPGESLTEEDIDKILTPAEKAYIFSLMEVANAEAQRAPIEGLPDEFNADRKVSKAYQIGQGIAEMTGYVAEFLLTGDITDAATAGATKAVQGWLVKNLMAKGGKTLGRKAARGLSKVAVNALTKTTSALMAAPVRTAAMGGTGGLGGAIAEQRTSLQEDGTFKGSASSVFGGAYDLAVENFTEEMGPVITDLLGAPFKPLVKPVKNWLKTADYDELGKLATLARKAGKIVDGTSPMAKALAKAGYHGSVEEYGEEFLGAVLRGELDEFFDKDQQLVLIGTFAPMSLLGMGGSAAHVIRTTKEVQAAAENMKVNLIKEGVDQKSADYMADYFRKTSAQKMKDEFAPVIGRLQQQSGLGEAFYTSDLYKSIARYIKAVAEYQTIDSQYKEQEAQQRVDKQAELEEKFGKFYNQADNTVNVVQLKDGRLVYQVTDFAMNGEAGAVEMKDGAATTFRAEDVQTYTDEEGNSHNQESGKMSLDSYLSSEIMRMKQSAQVARMRADRQKQIDALAKELPKTFDLGTKTEPLNVNVVSHDANGVKVEDANKNEITLGWEKVGRLLNKPIHVLTDNEIAEAEAADMALRVEAVRSKNAQSPAEEIDVEAEINATNEEVKSLQQKPEDAYTDKETGLVDEIAFWNNDPEGYCDWNDRQQNDGGIDSMKQIVNAKAAIESVIKKAEKEAKTDNPVTRRTAESIILSAQEQYDRLSAIEQKYAEQRTSNEEKRAEEVIAMRERISFWRERLNLGDRLVVLESLDEVTNPLAKKAISLGRTEGWYDAKEKKVYLYMPDIATRKVLDKTIMHEVVTHYGLDNLLGEQEYARLTDMVWNIMSDTAKRSFYNYAGVNTISDPVLRRRRAAEEFIALVAEDVSFERANAEKRSIWQRIVDFFSKLFEKDELNLTAKEIAEVLDKNIKGLTVGNEQIVEEFKAEAASVQPEVSKSEADLHTEAVLNESGMSLMEGIEENVTAQAETMTTAAGAPVTSDTNDGTTMLSTATAKPWVDNLGNEHRGTMEMVLERMKEKGFSEQEVKQMEVKMQTAYDYMMKLQSLTNPDGSVLFEEFNAWAEKTPYYKQIGRNFVKAITSLVSNGDYPINLELTTDCIKREAFTMLLNELVKRGADLAGMGPAEIVTIQKMMKQYGIQVACALCFVEGKRLQIVNWASQIVNDWNDALAEAGVETDEMFEFGKDGDAFIPADEWRTYEDKPALAKALRTIDEVAKIFQGVDPKVYKEQKAKNEKALEKYIKEKEEAAAKKGKKWTPTDEQKREMKKIKVEGLTPTYVNENMKEYTAAFEEMRNEWVSKSPKKGPMRDPLAFTPTKAQWSELEKIRNRQIENVKQKMVRLIMEYPEMRKKMTLNDLLGSKGLMEIRQQHGVAYEQLYSIILQRFGTGTPKPVQDAVPYDGEVMTLTESAFKAANKIGGARLFSFSDFDITKVFDYMQMFFDLEANRQMLQSYTKEVAAILLFGKSNAKFNISTLASAVVPAEVMEEYESANDARRRELRHQWAENAGLIVDENGTITGINFSEEHSVSPEFAQQIFHDDSRNKDCGAIMVGASVNHAIFSAAQDWIRMVIPFHLSGMPIAARDKTDVKWWTDNTEYQSTRKRTKDGWSKIDKKEDTFEFYADMHQEGWNMRDKAREYIEWCKSNAFRPKFDWGINSDYYRAYCEENGYTPNQQIIDMMDADTTNGVWNQYYKFLTDFTAFKPVFNEEGEMIDEIPSPQQRVVSNFDMSEMEKQVIFEGEYSMLARREGNIALANQHVSELADRVAPYLNGQITEEEMELRDDVFYDARKDAEAYLEALNGSNNYGNGNTFFKTAPRTAEQRTALFNAAKEEFGVTNNFGVAGYMLPDGTLLDFSEVKDGGPANVRTRDHREIGGIMEDREYDTRTEYITDFLNEGAIRIMPESDAINLSVAPSEEQRKKLLDYFYKKDGYIILELDNPEGKSVAYVEYDKKTSPYRIMRDIDGYFNEGIVPEQTTMFKTANNNQAIFVSNAAKAVEGIKMEKATPEQWLKMIEKNGGLKAGEDKWMGLSDFLKASDKKTLTKAEVLDFINENMIVIEEQHYGELTQETDELTPEVVNELQRRFDSDKAYYRREFTKPSDEEIEDMAYENLVQQLKYQFHNAPFGITDGRINLDIEDEDAFAELARRLNVQNSKAFKAMRPINGTRLNYTTIGLNNLHEIALTVPTIEPWGEEDTTHFGDAGDGRAVAWVRFGETTDESGNKVLVIDEIQSKRHQEGRERGYTEFNKPEDLDAAEAERVEADKKWQDFTDRMQEKYGERFETLWEVERYRDFMERSEIEEGAKIRDEFADTLQRLGMLDNRDKNLIPAAPFDKNWHELAMKRMLRYAAENGYDVVAWTKGEQQAERYNIGGVISEIKATKYPRGYEVVSFGKNGSVVHNEVFADESAMAGVYGKEMAQRIIESVDALEPSETATISGDNLRVGGEGMKGFYDQILPSFMNKYGKKWGVKVEDITLPNVEEAGRVMHSVPVTEEMKESVMEGQTMFKTRRSDQSAMSFAQQSMRDYVRKYGNVTYIEVMPVNDDTARELGYTLEELELMAGVYRGKKGIAIFAREKNTDSDQIETTIYHESVHHLHNIYPELDELAEYLWDNADDIGVLGKIKKNILAKIKGDEDNKKIEMLAFSMEYYAGRGEIDDLIGMVPDEEARKLIEFITNKTKYGRSETVREDSERGDAGRDTDGQTREQGEGSGNAEGENGEGTLFKTAITPEVRKEMDVIAAQAMVNGNYLKAPNGKDTKLTPEQWALVRTKNFLDWFGDWINDPENASKVVDPETGEPMVVYHGSPYGSITAFDRKGRTQSGLKEFGTYFTTNKKLAELYAYARQQAKKDIEAYEAEKEKLDAIIFNPDTPARIALDAFDELDKLNESQKPRVYEVFLNIKQPKVFDAEGKDGWNGWHKLKQDVGYDIKYGTEAIEAIAGHNRAARMDQSYDGIIAKNIADIHSDEVAGYLGDVFLVFDENPNQIKSATENSGEYSEDNEDIRFKRKRKSYGIHNKYGQKDDYTQEFLDDIYYRVLSKYHFGKDSSPFVYLDGYFMRIDVPNTDNLKYYRNVDKTDGFGVRFGKFVGDLTEEQFNKIVDDYEHRVSQSSETFGGLLGEYREATGRAINSDNVDVEDAGTGVNNDGLYRQTQREAARLGTFVAGGNSYLRASEIDTDISPITRINLLPKPGISAKQDAEYIAAAEAGDMQTAQRIVDEAARLAGYTEKIFHGTPSFGFTRFESRRPSGAIFTTTARNTAANYGGDGKYASVRSINKGIKDVKTTQDVLDNAKSRFDQDWRIATVQEREAVITRVEDEAKKVAQKMQDLNADFSNMPFELQEALSWMENIIYDAAEGRENGNEGDALSNMLKDGYKRFRESREYARQYIQEHYNELTQEQARYWSYINGFEVGDVAIDAGYPMAQAVSNSEVATVDGRSFLSIDELNEKTQEDKNVGTYRLYGNLGSNPLVIDAGKNVWFNLDYNGMRTTDSIAEWAKSNGYTSVIFKNIYDYGDLSDVMVFFEPSQVKSADTVTYDKAGNVISLSERFNSKDEDIRFSTSARDKSIDEIVMEGRQKVSSENTQAVDAFMDRIRRINGNLQQLRMAAAAQREYDQRTVKTITDIANDLLEGGALNDLTRGEIKRLLSIVNGGVGKNDLTKSVDRLMDLMVANQLRYGKSLIEKFLKIRGSKVDQRGVEVRGKLDIPGQQMLAAFKDGIGLSKDALANRIAEAEDALDSDSETKKRNAENELVGLYLALQYQEDINDSIEEEKSLRDEIKKADEDYESGIITKEMHKQLLGTIYEAILENRIQRVNAYEKLASDLGTKLVSSIKNAGILRDAEKERIQKIQHYANSDMKGMPASMHEVKENGFWNKPLVRFFLKPLATFDQMLRSFAPKSTSGEGYLWNHFMGGWLKATENEYKGVQKAHDTLDEAARTMFGEGVQRWSDLFEKERKMPKVTISVWDDGKIVEMEISQGNALYIYMVNKMTDGKMKLRRMGISQEDVDAIVAQMDQRFIALADWMQEQFLPSIRDKYNAVHERLFGAPMASIDNYFPIKVNARARTRDVDVEAGEGTAKPATITGSIIKRTRNSLALDIKNADAFDVMLEHIQQMEHWAAFAEFNKDLNTLLSYRKFRNRVENMSGIYGSGKTAWDNFKTVAEIAAGVYQPAAKNDSLDKAAMNIAKGVTAAKINGRVYTAMKQLLSMPAFVSDANIATLAKNMATPWVAWNWAMENLPMFEKRWKSRQAGDTRLMATESDWKLWKSKIVEIASRYGLTPNAFIDAVTVSIGAKSIYDTKYKEYLKMGYSEEQADKKAKRDATVLFNESQQSNESAFLSAVQVDRTVASVMFTVFRNSSMGYQRMAVDAWRNISHMLRKGYKEESVEFMKKQMVRDGLTEAQADRAAQRIYSRSFVKNVGRIAVFQFVVQFAWNLGAYIMYLLFGDDDEEKIAMIKDAAIRGLVGGPVEGLAGGSIVSNMLGNVALGEKLSEVNTTLLPVASDIEKVIKMLDYDNVAAYNEMFNILVQSGIGVNPQTLTDIMVAIDDACNGDPETSKEVALCIMRILQVPQSQIEKLYFDEIDFTADKGLDLTIEQFAKRYADYKVKRGTPLTGWMYDSEEEKEREDKYIKRFLKTAEELKRSRGNEEAKKYYEYLDTDYKEVTETISELRRNAEAAAMKGDQMGAMEYASMLNDFMKTDIFKDYAKFGGKAKAIEAIRDKMKKVDMQTREALEDMMLQLRKEMVEEMEQAKAETDAND